MTKTITRMIVIAIIMVGVGIFMHFKIPDVKPYEKGDMKVVFVPDDDSPENRRHLITLSAFTVKEGVDMKEVRIFYKKVKGEDFKVSVMQKVKEGSTYVDSLPGLPKGERWFYYIEAEDTTGNIMTIPERVKEGRQINFYVTFEGTANRLLFISHIVLAITAVIFWVHSVFYAVNYLITGERYNIRLEFYSVLYGTISFFIFAFPVGGYIAHQVFGQAWSGIPFGWDITDNKSLITFLYYAAILYLVKGKFNGRNTGNGDIINDKNFSLLVILGIVITVIVYNIPHSYFIQ
ncbi:MAG: hypothetical protein A3I04_00630 [Nitrospinae bacterium RIFCSPLOWO2_02_FULL_39_110]|nr:MAG: hypothetical protein A2W53_07750 [Nitrospinae bacterium RIFCSPHIGHO2_02_39_11]OGW00816.1 MAG: hypothetical protein A3D97_01240 [Nitrospinae bacterium RIFCSPHIGHO2_12_FULL_39_42]OGW02399.1 MAG: hypothetical protein A3D20_07540 [Nitrospinae bacterium RIFCSPHIGHO2_02_FULL_39_82]OGW03434.1 MAG: hypothetical protein A3I04_00630 [Nitrospinae bacterium RIFCSPLOWO2_02_FULL_39_110]OGW04945.1 MAG: hypothetical protein A2Z59_06475 [Nitrospinae bacterium RIFCSPLOWO2_02_39_17]OGW08025.1 MAG: hypoth